MGFVGGGAALAQPPSVAPRALLTQYCAACHSDARKTAGISFERLDPANMAAAAPVWEKALHKLRDGEMPPPGLPRPDASAAASFMQWLEASLDQAAQARPNPGGGIALSQSPGRLRDAIAHLEAALEIRPDAPEVQQALARLRAAGQ